MIPEERPDYVEKLEKALFEYVEKFGPTDAVRRLFRNREKRDNTRAGQREGTRGGQQEE